MKCRKCQSDNREGVKFCEECGAKLELKCPACKANIPLDKKFCGECGHKRSKPALSSPKELSFDEKISIIQRYLPQGLTQKILSQRDRIEGECKQVTVMFCDLAEYTSLTEKIGPEGTYQLMDEIYEMLIHEVHHYEGTVNEMTGDGILALFGAPIALEDAPQRAVWSALAIQREIIRIGAGKSRSRFEARAERGLSRFVGQRRELEILWDCAMCDHFFTTFTKERIRYV